MLKRTLLAFVSAVFVFTSTGFVVSSAHATSSPVPAAVSAKASNSEYIAAIREIMPSLQDYYTNAQLIKLGKLICQTLKTNSVASVDRTVSEYVTDEEAMALIGIATAAYCERYWPRVSAFYGID